MAAAESRIKLPNTPGRSISLNPVANGSTSASDPARRKHKHTEAANQLSALTLRSNGRHISNLFARDSVLVVRHPTRLKRVPANKIPLRATNRTDAWSVVRELADEIVGSLRPRFAKLQIETLRNRTGGVATELYYSAEVGRLIICNLSRFCYKHTAVEHSRSPEVIIALTETDLRRTVFRRRLLT